MTCILCTWHTIQSLYVCMSKSMCLYVKVYKSVCQSLCVPMPYSTQWALLRCESFLRDVFGTHEISWHTGHSLHVIRVWISMSYGTHKALLRCMGSLKDMIVTHEISWHTVNSLRVIRVWISMSYGTHKAQLRCVSSLRYECHYSLCAI